MEASKEAYVHAVVRGAGLLPWQSGELSDVERAFRAEIESRKDALLASREVPVHPRMLSEADLARAKANIEASEWAKAWFDARKARADYLVAQPPGYVETMISELTPTNPYGTTCPNCVGTKSQEGAGHGLMSWSYRNPDVLRCTKCGQVYPDPKFEETAELQAPRMGQVFTFYYNEAEQANPEDRSGNLAFHWVGKPIHISFSGLLRYHKACFMRDGVLDLAYSYALTGNAAYAARARDILVRFAHCYRNWLYHDYWDAIADCDPMYAAWHDQSLPLEWKKHLTERAFARDSLDKARMLQSYWGGGRLHPSTDSIRSAANFALAYDLVANAKDAEANPVWSEVQRNVVERDLLLEWIMGAEPYVGGVGKAACVNNKAPRIYNAFAAVAKALGLKHYIDVALDGYRNLRDQSFLYDGFSKESPAYTNMYLGPILPLVETLHGFRRPNGEGVLDMYGDDPKLQLMFRSFVDQRRPSGYYAPLSDTNKSAKPNAFMYELGIRRYPEYFAGLHPSATDGQRPTDYAVFHLEPEQIEERIQRDPPELVYPAWMTAFLRHGEGPKAALAAFPFNPPGGHRHYDNLALYYDTGGRVVLEDLGYVGDMPVNSWIKSTLSHNLVIVNDANQRHGERIPAFDFAATSPVASVVGASSNAYEACSEYRRTLALIKGPNGKSFLVDIFRVKGGGKHAFRIASAIGASDAPESALEVEGVELPPEPPLPDVGNSLAREDIYGLRDVRGVDDPPPAWEATWRERDAQYRLWMRAPVDRVEASNGPGQYNHRKAGRRMRYLDAVRLGENLESVFVAVHEACVGKEPLPVMRVERVDVPATAGPDALALRIDSQWGEYLILSEFENRSPIGNVWFQGRFGIVCESSKGKPWVFGLGASTLTAAGQGFENHSAFSRGTLAAQTPEVLTADVSVPEDWPAIPEGFTPYVRIHDGTHWTGFPVKSIDDKRISVRRFLLPPDLGEFELPALRYIILQR
ncbi:MAG: heparinase II/III family protein [Candidatus Hydrogenedentota bacterium]